MNTFKLKASAFLNSYYYPIIVFFAALISHSFSIELFGIIVILLSAAIGLMVCEDLRFFISPLIIFIFMFSQKSVASGVFYDTPYLIAMVVVAVIFLAMFVLHFFIHKEHVDYKAPIKSKLFIGIACLCGSFLLNGLFNFDEYIFENLIFALAMTVSLGLIFFLFAINLKPNPELKKYLFFVLFLTSILVVIEFFLSFTHQFKFDNGELVKESILLGWGLWNNIGGILAFLLPVHFYYACTVKKYGWVFYLTGVLTFSAIALSLSRASLLVSCFVIVACAIVSCFAGENKLTNRIITGAIAIIGIIGIIVLWDKIAAIFGDYLSRGFDDNGRFEMYYHGLVNFAHNPIFGGGFYSAWAYEYQFITFVPYRYCNTIIEMMATCGIVGLGAYLWHRYETVKLFWKKRSLYTIFCALCMAGFLGTSLLDNHFFNFYPSFIYVIMLLIIEHSENDYVGKTN